MVYYVNGVGSGLLLASGYRGNGAGTWGCDWGYRRFVNLFLACQSITEPVQSIPFRVHHLPFQARPCRATGIYRCRILAHKFRNLSSIRRPPRPGSQRI
jgi:hypothetical protein